MLSKLLKHEWRSTWKLPTALCVFTALMTLLGALSFRMPMWSKIKENTMGSFTFFDLLAVMILITYFISIIISAYAIMIYFAIRFYKNLCTDEGYLMHTLPVTPRMLIVSKTLVSTLWSIIASLLMAGSIFLLLYVFMRTLISGEDWNLMTTQLDYLMPQINDVFRKYAGMPIAGTFFVFLLLIIVSSFSGMLMIYGCICIGQLFKKHKVAAAIISYLVVTSVVQTIASVAVMPFTFNMMVKLETSDMMLSTTSPIELAVAPVASMMPLYYVSLGLSLVSAVVFHFVCEYIFKRKLNLD